MATSELEPRARAAFRALAGLGIAGLLLWLLFRGTDSSELSEPFRRMDLGWLLAGQVLLWATMFLKIQRWTYVVRAAQPASYRSLFSATQIGMLVNFTVPARLGELVRAYVLSRLEAIPVSRSLAMVSLDRVNDVIGLLAVTGVAALSLAADADVTFPAGSFGNDAPVVISATFMRPAAAVLAFGVVAASTLLVLLYVHRERVLTVVHRLLKPLSGRLALRVTDAFADFADGMHVFRSARDLLRSISWSLLGWGTDVAAALAIPLAFGLDVPWYTPFVMLSFVAVAILVPITPGTIGQFHVPAVAGLLLTAPAVSPAEAKAVAIVEHLSVLLAVAALGLFALFLEGLSLPELLRRSGRAGGVEARTAAQSAGAPAAGGPPIRGDS